METDIESYSILLHIVEGEMKFLNLYKKCLKGNSFRNQFEFEKQLRNYCKWNLEWYQIRSNWTKLRNIDFI